MLETLAASSFKVNFTPPTVLALGDYNLQLCISCVQTVQAWSFRLQGWNLKVGNNNIYDRAFADLHGCLDLLSYADSYIERHFTEVMFLMPWLEADMSFSGAWVWWVLWPGTWAGGCTDCQRHHHSSKWGEGQDSRASLDIVCNAKLPKRCLRVSLPGFSTLRKLEPSTYLPSWNTLDFPCSARIISSTRFLRSICHWILLCL